MTTFNKPGCYPFWFKRGFYYLQLFGAQGGQCNTTVPSGGFSSGYLHIINPKQYFFCVGGQGKTTTSGQVAGGFNGGGSGSTGIDHECGGSGGGQTDLRMEENDVSSVILVAGAGGGDGHFRDNYCGGRGGGTRGEDGSGRGHGTGGSLDDQKHGTGGTYNGDGADLLPSKGKDGEIGKGGDSISTAGGSTGGGGAGYFSGGGGADLGGGGGGTSYASSDILQWKTGFSNHTGDGFALVRLLTSTCVISNHKINFISCMFFVLLCK